MNDEPLANADSFTLNEDAITLLDILTNDSDIDGQLDITSIVIETDPSSGLLIDNADGTVSYIPDANFNGSDSFVYRVADNQGAETNNAVVSLTINPVNDAPTITGNPTTTLLQGEAYSFTPDFADLESSVLTVTVDNLPAWLSFNSVTGEIFGIATIVGTFSDIEFTVTDGQLSTSLALFTVEVIADTDGDGIANEIDSDDDNDGISDEFENSNGLDPLDASDALVDSDNDTINNLQEFLDDTDPFNGNDYFDITEPIVQTPDEITVDAVALFTPVSIRSLLGLSADADQSEIDAILSTLATDNVDGNDCCTPEIANVINGSVLLRPGRNLVSYLATDRMNNVGEGQQVVNVRPLVSVNKDVISAEGASVEFRVILNGPSSYYPFTVPYVIDNSSTTDANDHDLAAGIVTFTNDDRPQTESVVVINLTDDQIEEGREQLVIRLDDRTTDDQDLAGGFDPDNPDIFDINSGAKTQLTIGIVETNIPPDATLIVNQDGSDTIQVTARGGPVTISANVVDPNPGDSISFNWSATDNRLVDTDGNTSNDQFVFDPAPLQPGRYLAQITATDSQGATDVTRLYFRVVMRLPILSNLNDTDNDGVGDEDEGTADTDEDGIPNYLDNIVASNVLPEVARETNSFLVECDPGVRCRLGQFALLGNNGGARLEMNDIEEQEDISIDPVFENAGGVFDFEIHDLDTLGQTVSVVLPQQAAIPENGIYRKFQNNQWQNFVINANNQVHSAPGNLGFCPPPGDDSYESGLLAGYFCVQLTIEDGGPNDSDGQVHGRVETRAAWALIYAARYRLPVTARGPGH